MKSILTLSTLAVASLMSVNAQAVSWTLSDESVSGTRFGIASLNDVGDAAFGPITSDLFEITPTSVSVAGFDIFTAMNGGNSVDVSMSHEAIAESSLAGDTSTAYLELFTSVSLDSAVIADANTQLDAAATAPANYWSQSFTLTADGGEVNGMQALVTVDMSATHDAAATAGFNMTHYSSYQVWLNGNLIDADSYNGLGSVDGMIQFDALIGDTVTVQAISESGFEATGMMLAAGDEPYAWADTALSVSLNVTAVPEPETYALMLAGLGLVGFMARRRKSA